MRRFMTVLMLGFVAAACAGDTAGPADDATAPDEMAAIAYGAVQVGAAGDGDHLVARLANLPPALALSADQAARIAALVQDFLAATAADREALAAAHRELVDARRNDAAPDAVRAAHARAAEIRARLLQSERALRDAVLAVLTPAQRAALSSDRPREPRDGREPRACSESQRAEIAGLLAAFEQANAADIAVVRSAHERAMAARQAGAGREEISEIVAEARDAMHRLESARRALHEEIRAVGC